MAGDGAGDAAASAAGTAVRRLGAVRYATRFASLSLRLLDSLFIWLAARANHVKLAARCRLAACTLWPCLHSCPAPSVGAAALAFDKLDSLAH